MDFIIDRTSEDVAYAQSFIGEIWNKMSNAQQEEWLKGMTTPLESLKGFFNYTDMQRIKSNYNSLRTTYSYTGQDEISTTYNMSVIPNRSVMSADFNKILQFGIAKLPYFYRASYSDYRTLDLSTDVNRIDYNFVNNYEHILKNLYDFNVNGFLDMECEYNIEQNYIELDGIIIGSNTHKVDITVPSGYLLTVEKGHFLSSGYVVSGTTTSKTDGQANRVNLDSTDYGVQFKVESGITSEKTIITDNSTGVTIDVSMYDEVVLDTDLLAYNSNVDYTATDIQSSMIDVSSCTQMYVYNLSDYSGDIIITTYDENEDVIDEFALTTDLQIDLTDVYYFTIDSSVGDTLSYMTSVGNYFDWFYVTVGNNPVKRFPVDYDRPFDVSGESTLKIQSHQPYGNTAKCLFNVQKSIEGGLDISQLDTSEIEIKYM